MLGDRTQRASERTVKTLVGWLAIALAIFAGVTYIRGLIFWAIAHYELLGVSVDRASAGDTLMSTLVAASAFYPLDLYLHGIILVPGIIALAPVAARTSRSTFRVVACAWLGLLTLPTMLWFWGPLAYHLFNLGGYLLVGLLLPLRAPVNTTARS